MSVSKDLPKYLVVVVLAGGLGAWLWHVAVPDRPGRGTVVAVKVPELSWMAKRGKVAFDSVCAACHGANAAGSDKGPPLVHQIYNPGHHPDTAFFRAVRSGAPQHHWRFGAMPPQPQVTQEQITDIIQYIRELQLANGITWQPHNM
ncbi:Cytochrome c [Tistlia consotensis]|uniref:Cytochrome c n=1 Tax=Tistlia consotensis USBA 355 TaxID=560819 RepID=A0A1Y6BYL9_9PROT|nr:cytochrome c [Tistlia consotensis]SMF27594.1 Cytochrome c [Tistlia consotensis USBA 355]SNR65960.1 Cytochrome c [Tistlia consotensis]